MSRLCLYKVAIDAVGRGSIWRDRSDYPSCLDQYHFTWLLCN